MQKEDRLIQVVEDNHNTKDLKGVVDPPVVAVTEKEKKKSDTDILENEEVHFIAGHDSQKGKDGKGSRKGRGDKSKTHIKSLGEEGRGLRAAVLQQEGRRSKAKRKEEKHKQH